MNNEYTILIVNDDFTFKTYFIPNSEITEDIRGYLVSLHNYKVNYDPHTDYTDWLISALHEEGNFPSVEKFKVYQNWLEIFRVDTSLPIESSLKTFTAPVEMFKQFSSMYFVTVFW